MIEIRGVRPVSAANFVASAASARASSSESLTPASSVTAHIGESPVVARVIRTRGDHLVERMRLRDRHERLAPLGERRVDRQPEPDLRRALREPANPARQARGAHRDRARVDAERARLLKHGDRIEHRIEVRERLAHALETRRRGRGRAATARGRRAPARRSPTRRGCARGPSCRSRRTHSRARSRPASSRTR